MQILIIISCFLAFSYALLILIYRIGWQQQRIFKVPENYVPDRKISVVIAARNETANIEICLLSILKQNYPLHLFDITVVDDFSEDDTADRVLKLANNNTNLKLLRLSDFVDDRSSIRSFKKKALSIAIANTESDLIITTDADCIVQENWLLNIAAKQELTNAKMIVAPVDFTCNGSLVQQFQSLDFMTMQGITAAANQLKLGNMANGANLAFTRKAYEAVSGYEGIDHLVSGDDYLLMVKIQEQFPDAIYYLKSQDTIVRTAPQPDWQSFLQQRIRWASKSGKYKDVRLTGILALVYFFNLSLVILLIAGFFQLLFLKFFIAILLSKIILEIAFLWPVSLFFNKRPQLIYFPFLQPLHIIYISLAGFLGWKGKFVWKGRTIK